MLFFYFYFFLCLISRNRQTEALTVFPQICEDVTRLFCVSKSDPHRWGQSTPPESTKLSHLLLLFQDHAEINSTILRSQTNTARVEGLRSGTVYVVQVRARTVAGFGKYSSKMCFQTLTDGKDGRARREAIVQPSLLFLCLTLPATLCFTLLPRSVFCCCPHY